MRVVKTKAKVERLYNFLGIHWNTPSVVKLSIYMTKTMMKMMMMMMMIMVIIIIIIIIIFIYCNWVVTRWQWLFYMYTKHEIGYY